MTVFVYVSISHTPPTLYSSQPLNLLSNLHPFFLSRPRRCDPPRLKITTFLVPLPRLLCHPVSRLLFQPTFSLSLTSIHIPGYSCNKSLCCNFALLKAYNDGAQRKTKVGVRLGCGGGGLFSSLPRKKAFHGAFFFFFRNEPPGEEGEIGQIRQRKRKREGLIKSHCRFYIKCKVNLLICVQLEELGKKKKRFFLYDMHTKARWVKLYLHIENKQGHSERKREREGRARWQNWQNTVENWLIFSDI